MQEMELMQSEYEERVAAVTGRMLALSQGVPKAQRAGNKEWMARRRMLQGDLRGVLRWRDAAEVRLQDALSASAQALSHDNQDLEDLLVWSDFAEEAIQKSVDRASANEVRQQAQALSQVQGNLYAYGADLKYRSWFSEASGRPVHLGPVGASERVQPEPPQGWRFMSDRAFAMHWLNLGGYRSPEQSDENGWTALHHAMQATVHWDLAFRVCRGLICMMDPDWLRAKTWAGRPVGYSVLHMASNGSDCELQRGNLVRLLIEKEADVDAEDDAGRTPFLLSCGTGVVDVAMALSQAGCDIWARSFDGRNAADRCHGSSGSMKRLQHSVINSIL